MSVGQRIGQSRPAGREALVEMASLMETTLFVSDEMFALNDATLDDIRSILTEAQQRSWDEYLKYRRRDRTLARGTRFSGEGVDVTALARQLRLGDEGLPRAALLLYIDDIDQLLVERNRILYERERAHFENLIARNRGEVPSPINEALDRIPPGASNEEIERYLDRFHAEAARRREEQLKREEGPRMAIHRRIRDLNRSTVETLAGLLPGSRGEELRELFLMKAYPQIYGPSRFDAWIGQVRAMDLSAEQVRTIDETVEGYYRPYRRRIDEVLQSLQDREEEAWLDARLNRLDPSLAQQRDTMQAQRQALEAEVGATIWNTLSEPQQGEVGRPGGG